VSYITLIFKVEDCTHSTHSLYMPTYAALPNEGIDDLQTAETDTAKERAGKDGNIAVKWTS